MSSPVPPRTSQIAPVTNYLGTAVNGLVRMPVIFAGMQATLIAGEVAMRVIGTGLSFVGFSGNNRVAATISQKLPEVSFNVMRPFKDLTERQLGVSLVACTVIGTLGWEICNQLIDKAPDTYNKVNKWFSPLVLDSNWRNPVVAYLASMLSK